MKKPRHSGNSLHVRIRAVALLAGMVLALCAALVWKTWSDLLPLPATLSLSDAPVIKPQVVDRHGTPLTVTYQNPWNLHDRVPLHTIPALLQQAFIEAEDRRFFQHGGPDWTARAHALLQDLRARRAVRGASTITEQVVRMLHPRPRTLRSRWLEGIEAGRLEARFSKAATLELYLNQVPYAAQRRGVVQAARGYFDRDLDTLTVKETLALAVLVRSPARLDLRQSPAEIERPVARLAKRLQETGAISPEQYRRVLAERLALHMPEPPVQAPHFVQYLLHARPAPQGYSSTRIASTLDAFMQQFAQKLLDQRLDDLSADHVTDGAILVADHRSDEVLAWVSSASDDRPVSAIDAVTSPRQPGSALKPFVYALALEKGWTAATLIDDSPLAMPVGSGLHAYHNYSRVHYGWLRLRDALGNSLNIPAVRAAQFVGPDQLLERLHSLGFESLTRHPDEYGDGLALGNGEVTLLELVQAYATLARGGLFRPLRAILLAVPSAQAARQVFTPEVSSLIADILSDPQARRLEFGNGNLLRFPVQTAVKTGTSSAYHDAWAVGFDSRYTVGVWLGNLDQTPMRGITGSTGAALLLRAVMAELNKDQEPQPLPLSPGLVPVRICRLSGHLAGSHCPTMEEWFEPDKVPREECHQHDHARPASGSDIPGSNIRGPDTLVPVRLLRPTPGLELAMDPRIPDELEAFPLALPPELPSTRVEWSVDGRLVGITENRRNQLLWNLARGHHSARARVWLAGDGSPITTQAVEFTVK